MYSTFVLGNRVALCILFFVATASMSRTNPPWFPRAGTVATYFGRGRKSIRNVRVVAEASGGRMVVEAIGRKGLVVRITVKRENLRPLEADLFD